VIVLDIRGTPAAKGSPHARVHNGHVVMHEGKKTKAWEAIVRDVIFAELFHSEAPTTPTYVDTPLRVTIEFRLTRPGGHWGKNGLKVSAPAMPSKKPDIDKLARATLDPLIGSVLDDDSRIVELDVRKVYAQPGQEGARITVEEWTA
jgi:Holliday junction resolvase RusA-like endonuclease